ncbi:hypothetical protein PGTUg99_024414 [Puccinia graminis f. sp. tritici]|uniref:Uncharacterized protein n=1 Tax=Puccinia graminis f. sp. tritici TaxID=56615 RepID=A0A5B0QLZ2_PUCGR|nr:hypothetical protein PGTUg99_024414 [Puccinia graminis f. sp. tritici]
MKTAIVKHYQPKSLDEMKEAIQQGWDDIPVDHLKSLVKSMPNQMRLVVEASATLPT